MVRDFELDFEDRVRTAQSYCSTTREIPQTAHDYLSRIRN